MTFFGLVLLTGLACAGGGGELFVRGTVGLARAARLSPGIIAATVAAFATSSPELTVAVSSALAGAAEISLGDALGSNVVNVAVILGAALVIAPLEAPWRSVKRDLSVALATPLLLAVLLADGRLSRAEGLVLLACFIGWLLATMHEARRQRSAAGAVLGERWLGRAAAETGAGLALLIAAGKLIVFGATGVAKGLGLSEFAIGAIIVAVGTSVPELATAIVSRLKGHDEVSLGTVLGSNIFNGLFIVGIAATMAPMSVPFAAAAPALVVGLCALLLVLPGRSDAIPRWRSCVLLPAYAMYLIVVAKLGGT
jgi:cation:H+ antiporter